MYKAPTWSTATSRGWCNWALVAGPLSPEKPVDNANPVPAKMVRTPLESLRISAPAIYRLPAESTATPYAETFPATVVITPPETLRARELRTSAMYRLPAESTARPHGWFNSALMAGPLSPLNPAVPLPAVVVITPLDTLR